MKLFFVRHGAPDYKTDSLTEVGVVQADAVAKRLEREHLDQLFSSPCGRAQQTAAPTAGMLGLPVTVLPFMREIKWGWDGAEKEKNVLCHPWALSTRLQKEGADLWTYDPEQCEYWGGTRIIGAIQTVWDGIDNWLEEMGYRREGKLYRCVRENNDAVAIFSHAGSGTAALSRLLNLPPMWLYANLQLNLTSICKLAFDVKEGEYVCPEMVYMNDFQHINTAIPNVMQQ